MKLVNTGQYLLLIDEGTKIKEGEVLYGMDGIFEYKGNVDIPDVELPSRIIAYYPLTKEAEKLDLPLLPNPFEINNEKIK